ncbi:carbon starvation protein CstA [Lachnospiraceae bacterium PF1-21]
MSKRNSMLQGVLFSFSSLSLFLLLLLSKNHPSFIELSKTSLLDFFLRSELSTYCSYFVMVIGVSNEIFHLLTRREYKDKELSKARRLLLIHSYAISIVLPVCSLLMLFKTYYLEMLFLIVGIQWLVLGIISVRLLILNRKEQSNEV